MQKTKRKPGKERPRPVLCYFTRDAVYYYSEEQKIRLLATSHRFLSKCIINKKVFVFTKRLSLTEAKSYKPTGDEICLGVGRLYARGMKV